MSALKLLQKGVAATTRCGRQAIHVVHPLELLRQGGQGGVTCLSCRCSICWTSRPCSSAPHSPADRSSACCSSSSCCTHPRIRGWPRTNVLLPPAQPPPPAHMSTDPHQHENSHISLHKISECSDVYIQVRYKHTPPAAAALPLELLTTV